METAHRTLTLAPSLLSADFADLAEDIRLAEEGGADAFHLDVMDGHFVPNISFGPALVKAVRRRTQLPLDIHMMVSDPGRYLEAFAKAGGNTLAMHFESSGDPRKLTAEVRRLGAKPGLAVSPDTPLSQVKDLLPLIDELIVMGVYPGFSGQTYLPATTEKIREARHLIDAAGGEVTLSIDGGITLETAKVAAEAGASFFVCGNSVYGNGRTPQQNLQDLRRVIDLAQR